MIKSYRYLKLLYIGVQVLAGGVLLPFLFLKNFEISMLRGSVVFCVVHGEDVYSLVCSFFLFHYSHCNDSQVEMITSDLIGDWSDWRCI